MEIEQSGFSSLTNQAKIKVKSFLLTHKPIKLKVDHNFILIVAYNSLQNCLQGKLIHSNGYPFTLNPIYWNMVYEMQGYQKGNNSLVFNSSTKIMTLKTYIKLKKVMQIKNIPDSALKSLNILLEESRNLINTLYESGIVDRSDKKYFARSFQQVRLTHGIIEKNGQNIEDKGIQEIVQQLQNLYVLKSSTQSQRDTADSQIEDVTALGPDIITKEGSITVGRESLTMNDIIESVSKQISVGGYFQIKKEVCQIKYKSLLSENKQQRQYKSFDSLKFQYNNHESQKFSEIRNSNIFIDNNIDILAKKCLKSNRIKDKANSLKLQKQAIIVQRIINKKHMLQYFIPEFRNSDPVGQKNSYHSISMKDKNTQKPNNLIKQPIANNNNNNVSEQRGPIQSLLMKYHSLTLHQLIYSSDIIPLEEIMSLCQQVLQSVKNLHSSGVIHRDIKPSNFLIDEANFSLKIIDFAQSAIHMEDEKDLSRPQRQSRFYGDIFQKFDAKFYASTLPYSPVQCLLNKNDRINSGINNFNIDAWSIAMVISEIFYKKKPINYCKIHQDDIIKIVKSSKNSNNSFETFYSRAKMSGVKLTQSLINHLVNSNITSQQDKRMEVSKVCSVFKTIRRYIEAVKDRIRLKSVENREKLQIFNEYMIIV